MHELALARAVAGTIQSQGWTALPVQVRVSGGHGHPEGFEAALLTHIRSQAPELLDARIRIVHLPSTRMCGTCAATFEAAPGADCPACGGVPLPSYEPEDIEIVLDLPEEEVECA